MGAYNNAHLFYNFKMCDVYSFKKYRIKEIRRYFSLGFIASIKKIANYRN